MIDTLEVRGFRGFESFRVTDLTMVNLFVGKNNCGKSSVLEAVELIISDGHPAVFAELARRRGELIANNRPRYAVDISHLFYGHVCEPGAQFVLWSDEDHKLTATILSLEEVGEDAETWEIRAKNVRRDLDMEEVEPAFGLSIESTSEGRSAVLPVAKDGTFLSAYWPSHRRLMSSNIPVISLGLESFSPSKMRDAWDEVLAAGGEHEIAKDMQLLVPEIDSIHFLTVGRTTGGGILVGHAGVDRDGGRRTPIGSYGDGLRRLLALRLALVGASGGFLLIDEIDAAFHWTVMEDLWRLLVEVARRSNLQIFATTHSYDCIRGLGSLVRSRPNLAENVAMHKLHPSLEQAVCFPGEQIPIAVEQGIELR